MSSIFIYALGSRFRNETNTLDLVAYREELSATALQCMLQVRAIPFYPVILRMLVGVVFGLTSVTDGSCPVKPWIPS